MPPCVQLGNLPYSCLQVMLRWQEFNGAEQVQLANMMFDLFKVTGNTSSTWAVRSKGALLMSLVSKRMGQPFWEQLLPELLKYSSAGPVQAEKVNFPGVLYVVAYQPSILTECCSPHLKISVLSLSNPCNLQILPQICS